MSNNPSKIKKIIISFAGNRILLKWKRMKFIYESPLLNIQRFFFEKMVYIYNTMSCLYFISIRALLKK